MTEVTIERLGHLGDGIAPGPVYAHRTLPGEIIAGDVLGNRIDAPRIVTPSPDRVTPPCPHYRACGGCQLMHASDGFTAGWKQEIARAALAAQGLDTEWRALQSSPPASRRRATFAARRTKKGTLVGFHGRASGTITEIPGCRLLDPVLLAGLPAIHALTEAGASRKGALDVTVTATGGGLDMAVSGGKPADGPLRLTLAGLAETHDLARLSWDGDTLALRRPPVQTFGRAEVSPPPGAFLQATPEGEAALLSAVREITRGARRIVDLFAGSGTFALPLAEAAEVHAVEGNAAMTGALDRGWRHAQGLKRVTTEARDLFRRPLMPDELAGFDAAVIDPPRAGAEAQILELARARLPVIAHVSCNPVTFARDARVLADAGYSLDWVQVVDQFRWSVHVELVGAFRLPN